MPRTVLALHVLFFAAGGVVLSLDAPAKGWGVLGCVVAYVVLLPLAAHRDGRPELQALALFLAGVSVFQVVPDWVLADVLGILAFPDTGGLRVDDVIPLAMAGMWVAPLFIALALAGARPGRSALFAVLVFAGAEFAAPTLGLWEPIGDTTRVAGIAIYVLPAEAALAWATAVAFNATRTAAVAARIAVAAAVSTFYLGALVTAYFLIDVAGYSLTR
ncbi:DUF6989 domain-containing protein [Aeromicrobium marinum]|uniref:DUF6989 domain-containing protein n=1 Tax=Aeromicrobium marinum TaxID=219314 RepID=UPI0026A1C52E